MRDSTADGGPASPVLDTGHIGQHLGMTLLDHYVGMCLSSWIMALAVRHKEEGFSDAAVAVQAARLAVTTANAVMAFRETVEK